MSLRKRLEQCLNAYLELFCLYPVVCAVLIGIAIQSDQCLLNIVMHVMILILESKSVASLVSRTL